MDWIIIRLLSLRDEPPSIRL